MLVYIPKNKSSTELPPETDLHLKESMKVSCVYNHNALAKQWNGLLRNIHLVTFDAMVIKCFRNTSFLNFKYWSEFWTEYH